MARQELHELRYPLGEGAYYAADLTKIAEQSGEAYLAQFLKNPSTFYSEEKDRRLMPNLNLGDQQIRELITFLSRVSRIGTNGWPPRPLLVSGTFPGASPAKSETAPVSTEYARHVFGTMGYTLLRDAELLPARCSSYRAGSSGRRM